jgi:hypothetical protein
MKRTTIKEIFIEIETIRVTRRRSVRKNSAEPPKSDVSNHDRALVKTDARLKQLFDKLF